MFALVVFRMPNISIKGNGEAMDVEAFTARMRQHYIEQFRAFVAEQKQSCVKGAPEVKLRLGLESGLYRQLYCIDFIKNDPPELIELQPERFLSFEALAGAIGDARLSIEHLRWDDVLIYHDLGMSPEGTDQWFARWFDEEEERLEATAEFSNTIHSLLVEVNRLSIDFGTAPTAAFRELLDLLEAAGAKSIRVTSSRAEAGNE
jgi:hypothetical protein